MGKSSLILLKYKINCTALVKRWERLHADLEKLEKEHPERIDNLDSHRGQLSALYFCINELKFALLKRK